MEKTLIEAIIEFVMGRKYWANIINTRGTDKCELCSFIFGTRAEAEEHRLQIATTRSFLFVETITFRSRRSLVTNKTSKNK